MLKLIFIVLGLMGLCYFFTFAAPVMWYRGFDFFGHSLPWAFPVIGLYLYFAFKIKV